MSALESWLSTVREDAPGPSYLMALIGSEGVGKSRLAEELLSRHPGRLVTPEDAAGLDLADGAWLVVDDAEKWAPMALFTVINQALAAHCPLLLLGENRPVTWVSDLSAPGAPDLRSRLASIAVTHLDAPEASAVEQALAAALHQCGLKVPDSAVRPAAARLCRRFSSAIAIAQSAVRFSPTISAPKALLEAAMSDNPGHCLD